MAEDRILLVTVNKHETTAVLEAFKVATGADPSLLPIDDRVYRDLGTLGGTPVFHALSEMGSGSVGASQQTIEKAIRALEPTIIVAVGIAFGVDPHKQSLGDILVSRQLLLYELQRVGKTRIVPRGDKPHASGRLINLFDGVAQASWQGAEVRVGPLLTGEKLLDNEDYRADLIALESEAIGGEMEGAGIYVACQDRKIDWIVIKAICDWADGEKGKNKTARQKKAATSAAAFVAHALSSVFQAARHPGASSPGESGAEAEAEAVTLPPAKAMEQLERLSAAVTEYRMLFANYSSYILNKVPGMPARFETKRLELDRSMIEAFQGAQIYLPKQLRSVIGRIRKVASCSLQDPLQLYYELFHASGKFPREPVEAAEAMLTDLVECFFEMTYEFGQGRRSSASYLGLMRQHFLDENANSIRERSPPLVAGRAVILEHEYLRAERSSALAGLRNLSSSGHASVGDGECGTAKSGD